MKKFVIIAAIALAGAGIIAAQQKCGKQKSCCKQKTEILLQAENRIVLPTLTKNLLQSERADRHCRQKNMCASRHRLPQDAHASRHYMPQREKALLQTEEITT